MSSTFFNQNTKLTSSEFTKQKNFINRFKIINSNIEPHIKDTYKINYNDYDYLLRICPSNNTIDYNSNYYGDIYYSNKLIKQDSTLDSSCNLTKIFTTSEYNFSDISINDYNKKKFCTN